MSAAWVKCAIVRYVDTPRPARASTNLVICSRSAGPVPDLARSSPAGCVRTCPARGGATATAPFLAALAPLPVAPLAAVVPLAAVALLGAPVSLTATPVPPEPAFLALAWAARAFRARLDFEAVIRAPPPVVSRQLCAWLLSRRHDSHPSPDCILRACAPTLRASCRQA